MAPRLAATQHSTWEKRVFVGKRAVLPEPRVIGRNRGHRLGDKALNHADKRFGIVDHDARIRGQRIEAQNHFAHQIVLLLCIGRVADTYRLGSAEAVEVIEMMLDEVALTADTVQRLERAGFGDIAKKRHERFSLGEVPDTAQRFDDEGSVP